MEPAIVFMTYETLYSEILDRYISSYKEEHLKVYNEFTVPEITCDIQQLIESRDKLEKDISYLKDLEPNNCSIDMIREVQNHYELSISEYQLRKMDILESKECKIQELEEEVKRNNMLAKEASLETIKPLAQKHKELLDMQEDLRSILGKYNIRPSDIEIDDSISKEEFEALIDSSVLICKSMVKKKKNVSKFLSWPLSTGENKTPIYYLILLMLVGYILLPFLAIAYGIYSVHSILTMYKKIDKLRIADSLMHTVDYTKYIDEESISLEEVDVSDIEKDISDKLDELEINNPDEELNKALDYCKSKLDATSDRCYNAQEAMKQKKAQILNAMQNQLEVINKTIKECVDNRELLGSKILDQTYIDPTFKLAEINDILYDTVSIPLTNLVFKPNIPNLDNLLKVMLVNILSNVKEKHLTVDIYDPDNIGVTFSKFYTTMTEPFIKVYTDNFEDLMKGYRDIVKQNIRLLDDKDINEHNKDCEAVGKVTLDYKLIIIQSGLKELEKNETFLKFMSMSARYGILIWLVQDIKIDGTLSINTDCSDSGNPIQFKNIADTFISTYEDAIDKSKDKGLDYFEKFANKYIPRDKWWTYNTIKGIGLNFGLEDGDPDKGYDIMLGDNNVHGLMGGMTGAGKSATINQLLCTLMTKYSPRELSMCLVDFKNVEFSAYSRQESTGFIIDKEGNILEELGYIRKVKPGKSILPHAEILAGTKDGEYALSIFDYLIDEMTRRQKIFTKNNVKNIQEYREKFPNEIMPRVLLLIDEFQVMFTEVDQKIVEKIKSRITSLSKLARYCGCHMLFTSQSMNNTLSKDVLDQFSLRAALRCSSNTSTDLIGCNLASQLKSKVGYLYTNTDGGENQNSTRLWRIPYIDTPDIMRLINELRKKREELGELDRRADFYDETRTHTDTELNEIYDKYSEEFADDKILILGESTMYSRSIVPKNFALARMDSENVLAGAESRRDMLNLSLTFMDNINRKAKTSLIVNCADMDVYEAINWDNYVKPELQDLIKPMSDVSELLDSLLDIVYNRQEMENVKDLPSIYFVALSWERQAGIFRNEIIKVRSKLMELLKDGPTVGVHTIIVCKSFAPIPTTFVDAMSHKVAGKISEKDALRVMVSSVASKLPDPSDGYFGQYVYQTTSYKFKIYQHKFETEFAEREVVITRQD